MSTMTFVGELQIITCGGCNIVFAMSTDLYEKRIEDHQSFYCPNGCKRHFIAKSDKEKLEEEIQRLEARNLNLDRVIQNKNVRIEQLKYSVRAQKSAKTKILNRVKNGVCPCCNRTFKDLQNHFKTSHPELLEVK